MRRKHESSPKPTMEQHGHGSRLKIDPRTKLLLLFTCNVLLMSLPSINMVAYVAPVIAVLMLLDTKLRWALGYTGFIAAALAVTALVNIWPNAIVATIAIITFWAARFAAAAAVALWFLTSTKTSQFIASLNAMRLPPAIIIPFSVVFRFLPVAVTEFKGVLEALALRGYSVKQLAFHPLKSAELIAVPMLSAAARIADELAAAALIRGLGANKHPTTTTTLKFTWHDAATLLVIAGLITIAVMKKLGVY